MTAKDTNPTGTVLYDCAQIACECTAGMSDQEVIQKLRPSREGVIRNTERKRGLKFSRVVSEELVRGIDIGFGKADQLTTAVEFTA
jgi:hypothetical protein